MLSVHLMRAGRTAEAKGEAERGLDLARNQGEPNLTQALTDQLDACGQ